jgi:hypothetical protein
MLFKIFLLQFIFSFSLAGENFTAADLQKLIAENPKTKKPVQNMAELLPLLPAEFLENFTFVYDSRSPFQESISTQYPRIILFSKDAKLILTMTADPNKTGYDLLEYSQWNQGKSSFEFAAVPLPDFKKNGKTLSAENLNCNRCHGIDPRPINDSYPLWPGFYGSFKDTFAKGHSIAQKEEKAYKEFKKTTAKSGLYSFLKFGSKDWFSPYLNPKKFDDTQIIGDLNLFSFMPNTRLGMALTELNRKRIFRKLAAEKNYATNEKKYLVELLSCAKSAVPPTQIDKMKSQVEKENEARLIRYKLDPKNAKERINDMIELKFITELAQINWVAETNGMNMDEWSLAMEKNSMSFFDGILSGIHDNVSYYLKEDLIYEMMKHLSRTDKNFKNYFARDAMYAHLGYPFGHRIQIEQARKACGLLTAAQP